MIHESVTLGQHCEIDDDVTIGAGSVLGRNVRVFHGSRIGRDCRIEDNVIIGYAHMTKKRHEVRSGAIIGDDVLIRPGCQIYAGCSIGDHSFLNHGVMLREETRIGSHTSIGSLVWCEGYTVIGSFTTIHAQCHLTARMTVGDYVFFGPMVCTANARRITHRRRAILDEAVEEGPIVEFGCRIGSQAMLLPGVRIGREALIGASALVTKNVAPFSIAIGSPARVISAVPERDRLQPGSDFAADHPILDTGGIDT